ncbi:MAG: hypothetical protein ACRCYY_21425 [Trueperaceae bacterium]
MDYWQKYSLAIIRGERPPMPQHNKESFPDENEISEANWQACVSQVLSDLKTAADLSLNQEILKHQLKPDFTIQDELTVLAAHNAYHFGRMVMLRQLLSIWSSQLGDTW